MLPERRAWSQPIIPLQTTMSSRKFVPTMNTPQLGFIDPGTLLDSISNIFGGLFGKDPEKVEFDSTRQQIWNQYANMVDTVDAMIRSNQLTFTLLEQYVQALRALMDNFTAYYQRMRQSAGAAWTDPRYHDFFDPMQVKYNEWIALLSQMTGTIPTTTVDPVTGVVTSIPSYSPVTPILRAGVASATENWPLILLGIGALAMFSRSTRSTRS